jgi:parallel beta-helix repeat protein
MRVEKVEISDTASDGILIYEMDDFEILDCTLRNTGDAGIRRTVTTSSQVARARVRGNVVQDSGADGIILFRAIDSIVENNRVLNAGAEGIQVGGSGFVVRDNLIRGTQGVSVPPDVSSGLSLQGQAGEVRGNVVTGGAGVGILLLNITDYSLVVENSVSDNAEQGIDVSGNHVLVERNVVAANGGVGIFGRSSSAPLVYRNNMLQGNGGGPVDGFVGAVEDGGGNICDGVCP